MTTNSDFFDLSHWKLTLPVDAFDTKNGDAVTIGNLIGYEHPDYFYDNNGAMVFRVETDGAIVGTSPYPRTELRELQNGTNAQWTLDEGGTMSATLRIDEVATLNTGASAATTIGQIHGGTALLAALSFRGGQISYTNYYSGTNNQREIIYLHNANGQRTDINIGENFSYIIEAREDTLTVKVYADGQEYSSVTSINAIWQTHDFYFKAGAYAVANDAIASGATQVTFLGLDLSHTPGEGDAAWLGTPLTTTSTPSTPTVQPDTSSQEPVEEIHLSNEHIVGDDSANWITGGTGEDTLYGQAGDDVIFGNQDNDTLYGGVDNDFLHGGQGNDMLTGNEGDDQSYGGIGDDYIHDGSGANILLGNQGDDTVIGGQHNDFVHGGQGDDTLTGNAGDDTFGFGAGNDIITDFEQGGDKLFLHNIAINYAGNSFIGNGQASAFISSAHNNAVIYLDKNGDGIADASLIVNGIPIISEADIIG